MLIEAFCNENKKAADLQPFFWFLLIKNPMPGRQKSIRCTDCEVRKTDRCIYKRKSFHLP
jgi:hypothetical protein